MRICGIDAAAIRGYGQSKWTVTKCNATDHRVRARVNDEDRVGQVRHVEARTVGRNDHSFMKGALKDVDDDRDSCGIEYVEEFGSILYVRERTIRREDYSDWIPSDPNGAYHCVRRSIEDRTREQAKSGGITNSGVI